ncbi:MAG: hypothetical protein VW378_04140 [bacterium]
MSFSVIYLPIFLLFVLFTTAPLHAQSSSVFDEFDDNDLSVVSTLSSTKESGSFQDALIDAWNEQGKGYFTSGYSKGNTMSSFSNLLLFTYSHSFWDTLLVSSVEAFSYTQKFQTQINNYLYSSESGWTKTIETLTVTHKNNAASFRELYIKRSLSPKLEFRAGKQLVIWGQMPLMSMVDYILPRAFSKTPSSVTKLDNRVSLDTFSLSYYPVSSLELTAYVFNKIELPTWQIDAVELFLDHQNNNIIYEDQRKPFAVRGLWRHPSVSVGITYFKGMHWQPVYGYNLEERPNFFYSFSTDSWFQSGSSIYPDYSSEYMLFAESESFGFELSKRIGSNTFVFEIVKSTRLWPIDDSSSIYRDDIFNWLYEYNNKSNLVIADSYMYSFGVHGDYSWGDMAFLIFFETHSFPAYDMETLFLDHEATYSDNPPVFGFILSKDLFKTSRLGFGIGYLPQGIGVRFFIDSEYKEAWKWTFSPQFITPLNYFLSEGQTNWEPSLSFSLARNF